MVVVLAVEISKVLTWHPMSHIWCINHTPISLQGRQHRGKQEPWQQQSANS